MNITTCKHFEWTFNPADYNNNVNFMEAILKAEPTIVELRNIDMNNSNNNSALSHIFSPENQWLSSITELTLSSSRPTANEDILIDSLASNTCRRFDALKKLSMDFALSLEDLQTVFRLLRGNMDAVTVLTMSGKDLKQQETQANTHAIGKFLTNTINMTSVTRFELNGYNFSEPTKRSIQELLRGWHNVIVSFDGTELPRCTDETPSRTLDDLYSYYEDMADEGDSSRNDEDKPEATDTKRCRTDMSECNGNVNETQDETQ